MVAYKGKELTRFKEKSGGKNNSPVDGFYKETDGDKQFFIKKPADQGELFAELFAGLLIQEFMKRKLIDEVYFPSLICADVVQFDDKSYGLIQPLVSFDELHKIIGTTRNDGNDRSVWSESLLGPRYYTALTQQGEQFGLSMALMFSLWLGAHSVHSGNIVLLKKKEHDSKQFGRIDWGDAFRHFANPQNNDNILYPYENRGWFNYKSITKDFFLNYKNIKGLFPAMAEKGLKLKAQLNEEVLRDIVNSALRNIPVDLIDKPTRDKFAKYMAMDSFTKVTFGTDGNGGQFATEMASLLLSRLTKISDLKDLTADSTAAHLYESIVVRPITLFVKKETSFPDAIKHWQSVLPVDRGDTIDNSVLDLASLAQHFNAYVDFLANQCDATNLWEHESPHPENLFTPYYKKMGEAEYGHAFVSQYKESTVLRRLFTLNPNTLSSLRFDAFEGPCQEYAEGHEGAPWVKVQKLLTLGQGIINTLAVIKQSQEFGLDKAVEDYVGKLKLELAEFVQAEQNIPDALKNAQIPLPNDTSFFYPIEDSALNLMTGEQLATLCLEELNHPMPSPLIERIIKNNLLWNQVSEAFDTKKFDDRLDTPVEKILKIRQWHHLLHLSDENNARLKEQAETLTRKMESQLKDMEEKNGKLLRQVEELQQQMSVQTVQLQLENRSLRSEVTKQSDGRASAEQSVKHLVEEINKQRLLMEKMEQQLSEQVAQLQQENGTLHLEIDKQSEAKASAEQSVALLKAEIQKQQQQAEEIHQQLTQLVAQLQKEKEVLHLEVKKQSAGKTLAEQSVVALKEEIQELQRQIAELQQQVSAKEQENTLLNAQIQQIKQLKEQVDAQKNQMNTLSEQLLKVGAEKQALTLAITQLKHEKDSAEDKVTELEHRYTLLTQSTEQLQEHLMSKEKAITEAMVKLREQAHATEENAARLIAASSERDKTEQARIKLQKEMDALQLALRQQEIAAADLQQIIKDSEKAERLYQKALEDKKDRQFARMERMAPILLQVQEIEKKAKQLSNRKETAASDAATLLAGKIRKGIKKYTENGDSDEVVALNQFKEEARGHIEASKIILGEHREEWKYILANISLAILLVGIGYVAAALINKQVTGNYTFFSTTESKQKVEKLEEQIEVTNIKNSAGG